MQSFLRVVHTLTLLLSGVLLSNLLLAQEETVAGFLPARLAIMDSAIQADIDAGNIAGIVVAVARNGQIVHNKAYGFADRENGEKMTTDNLFRPNSKDQADYQCGPAYLI